MKINFFKKRNTYQKKNYEIDADFYWRVILYVMLSLVVLGGFFGFYVFSKVNKDAEGAIDPTLGQVGTVKKDRIEKVLESYSLREEKSKEILNSTSPVVDPSR